MPNAALARLLRDVLELCAEPRQCSAMVDAKGGCCPSMRSYIIICYASTVHKAVREDVGELVLEGFFAAHAS